MPLSKRDLQPQEPRAAPETEAVADQSRCTECSGGVLARQEVKTAFWEGKGLVIVEGIPALVCQSCGEQYYEDEIAMKLDLMRGTGFAAEDAVRNLAVPVFEFDAAGPGRKAETDDAQA